MTLVLVIGCHTRELQGWHLSRCGKASNTVAVLELVLNYRFSSVVQVTRPFLERSHKGLGGTSWDYAQLVSCYGLKQEFITLHCPQQSGMVDRVIRTLKDHCIHRHRFEIQQNAMLVIGDWISFYKNRRPHIRRLA